MDSHSRWLLQNNGEPAHALELSDTTRLGIEQSLDFDHWRQLGNPGWAWSDVLPYFKKAESWQGGASDIGGGDGPLSVSSTRFTHPINDCRIEAATTTGYETSADYNGAQQDGVGYYQMTTHSGRRCSTAVAYLRCVGTRKGSPNNTNGETRGRSLRRRNRVAAALTAVQDRGATGPGGTQHQRAPRIVRRRRKSARPLAGASGIEMAGIDDESRSR